MASYRYVGRGLYTVPEASRLIHASPGRIRRWLHGYDFRSRRGELRHSEPVIQQDPVGPSAAVQTLYFADLIDMLVVNALRDMHVAWPTIRNAAAAGQELLRTNHPFASKRLVTDGAEIFVQVGGQKLMNIVTKQLAWKKILKQFLHQLDFNQLDEARQWWPLGRRHRVVVDPERAFGTPIVLERVPTWVLAASARAEGSMKRAAWVYEIPVTSVRDAVRFERGLAATRAA